MIVAAVSAYASPTGYQANLMAYGPSGCRSGDFLRMGAPLTFSSAGVAAVTIALVWPF